MLCKVTVIIPVYNTEQYLISCLESVVHQTLKELEIILVNDGSTDGSLQILEQYKEQYPDRIQLITKVNEGQATARNLAIPLCNGAYIGFVDSDDCIELDMYEKLYNKAIEADADYVECDYVNVKVNQEGEIEQIPDYGSRVREYTSKKDIFIDTMAAPWNKIYRAEILQKNHIRFPEGLIYEDTSFTLKAISRIEKFAFVPEKLVIHYYRGSSTMNQNKSKKVADIFLVLEDVLLYYREHELLETYKEELEYEICKILLCSSMVRIASIPDNRLRRQFSKDTWTMVQKYFPNYKTNHYLKKKGMTNLYMKLVSGWNISMFSKMLSFKKAGL